MILDSIEGRNLLSIAVVKSREGCPAEVFSFSFLRQVRVVGKNPHAENMPADSSNFAADPAETQQPDRLAADISRQVLIADCKIAAAHRLIHGSQFF